jgi:hypothetical protein
MEGEVGGGVSLTHTSDIFTKSLETYTSYKKEKFRDLNQILIISTSTKIKIKNPKSDP